MPEFADPVKQVTRNPFAGVSRPTTGAIVRYVPPTAAVNLNVRPVAAVANPVITSTARRPFNTTVSVLRNNTVNAPVGRTLDQINRITPKSNVPLVNKINARLARGFAAPVAAAPAATRAAGWFARARGVFTRVAPVVNRAVGIYGWITLAADGMEAARPYVWQALGIKDPNAPAPSNDLQGLTPGRTYQVVIQAEWSQTPEREPWNTGTSSWQFTAPIGQISSRRYSNSSLGGNIWSIETGAGVIDISRNDTFPGGESARNFRVLEVRDSNNQPVDFSSPSIPSLPVTSNNPQRSPAGKASQNPKTLPSSQPQRSPKPSTRPQNPTTTKPQPFPQPNPDGPPSTPKAPPEVKPGECDPCEALGWLVDEAKRKAQEPKPPRTYQLRVPYVVCEGKESEKEGSIRYFSFDVLQEPGNWLETFTASAELALKGCECNDNAVASIPDWWQVRLGAERPQLVVVFKIAGTRAYHQLAIPHPTIKEPPGSSPLPPYRKGPYQGQLILADNSKFTINAASEDEAQRMVDAAARAISRSAVGSQPRIHIGQRKGVAVKEADMVPIRLDYYPTGQRDLKPAWRKRLESPSPSR